MSIKISARGVTCVGIGAVATLALVGATIAVPQQQQDPLLGRRLLHVPTLGRNDQLCLPASNPAWWYQVTEVATGSITNWNTRPGIEGKTLWLNHDSVRDPSLQVPVLHVKVCFHGRNVLTHPWWQKVTRSVPSCR
jgi:hypothetical protein